MTGKVDSGRSSTKDQRKAKEEGKLAALPIRLCEPHPDLQTRLRYDQVDRLAEDIRVNGQLQPGRAVEKPDGTGYLVYLGIGRLLAIKKLFEDYGEPRSYFAMLDEGLPFVELFSRSMSENLKRRNLSVLEEVRSYYLASKLVSEKEMVEASGRIGEGASVVKRRIALAALFGDKLESLYEIETRAGFSFQLGHLEVLAKLDDEKAFYETAAVIACSRFSVKEAQASLRTNSLGHLVPRLAPWFAEVFPQYSPKEQGGVSAGAATSASVNSSSNATRGKAQGGGSHPSSHSSGSQPQGAQPNSAGSGESTPPADVTYKEEIPFVECPYCGAQNPFELKEKSVLTLYRFEGAAVPRKDSASPEGVYRRSCTCVNATCRKELWLMVSSIDGTMMAEVRTTVGDDGFSLPSAKPKVGSISWNSKRHAWLVREKGEGAVPAKLYLYGEDRRFVEA